MKVYVIRSSRDFDKYIYDLEQSAYTGSTPSTFAVGFDTERISKYSHPIEYTQRYKWVENTKCDQIVCTIQISTDSICLIIHLPSMKLPLPKKLLKIITNDSWLKAGVGIGGDLSELSKNYNLGQCNGGIELSSFALIAGCTRPNLGNLYKILLGKEGKKDHGSCNWALPLTKIGIEYASRDAIMGHKIYKIMMQPTINQLETTFLKDSELDLDILYYDFPRIDQIRRLNKWSKTQEIEEPSFKTTCTHDNYISICHFGGEMTEGNGSTNMESKNNSAREMIKLMFGKW